MLFPYTEDKRFGLQHHRQGGKKSNVHTDKQPRMFTDKTDTKAGFVVAFFAGIQRLNRFGQQALYFGHRLPSWYLQLNTQAGPYMRSRKSPIILNANSMIFTVRQEENLLLQVLRRF